MFRSPISLDGGQSRQLVQALKAEVIEEFLGGAEHFRMTRYVAMTHEPDPTALLQGAHDLGIDGDAAHAFDLTAGDGLTISNQRKRLQ